MSFRAQASLEYFLIFMISLMVAAGVIFVLFNITSGADNILPSSCVFDMGINCYGLMVASNSLGTTFALLGSNTQQYPMSNIGLSITLGAATIANMQCSPGVVAPGQSFLCIESTGQPVPQAYSLKGGLTASVSYCGLSGGDCDSGTMAESYVGTYTSPITQSSLQNFDVVLSPPMYNPPRTPSGSYLVNATLEIFGRNFTISSTKIVPGSDAVITNELNGSTLVETINSICGMKDVSVSYMGMNASEMSGARAPDIKRALHSGLAERNKPEPDPGQGGQHSCQRQQRQLCWPPFVRVRFWLIPLCETAMESAFDIGGSGALLRMRACPCTRRSRPSFRICC